MEFEWDPEKEVRNLEKHGISFAAAARVLEGGGAFEYESSRAGEARWVAVGRHPTRHCVIAVVYALREGRFRIISARRARDHEQAEYHRQLAQGVSGRTGPEGGPSAGPER